MGGYGFDVEGVLAPEIAERHVANAGRKQSGVLSRVVGRLLFGSAEPPAEWPRFAWQADAQLGRALLADLGAFVRARAGAPWTATAHVLDEYLHTAGEVGLRGAQDNDGEPWRFSLGLYFSGCAGLGETSARVVTHWALAWWQSERARLEATLAEHGFTPRAEPAEVEDMFFLPAGEAGYAEYNPAFDPADEDPDWPTYPFEVDAAAEESGFEDAPRLLTERFSSLFDEPRCRCQLCAPDFDEGEVVRALGTTSP